MKKFTLSISLYMISVSTITIAQQYTGEIIFPTLQIVIEYSKTLSEKPAPDTSDWQHVSFKNYFYARKHPKTWAEIKHDLSIGAMNLSVGQTIEKSFKEQIKKTIKQRQKAGFKESFVRIIRPEPGSRFIIMANLNGSFHFLVRFLEYGSHHWIIDDNFTIKPPYFLVFDGNALADSAYGLDTLALILRLIEVNPDRVMYVRGRQEEKGRWQTTNLNSEIDERIIQRQELKTLLGTLFDTFPLALYIVGDIREKSIDLVRICNFALEDRSFDEQMVASLLRDPNRQVIHIDEQSAKYATTNVHVQTLIHGSLKPSKAGKGVEQTTSKDGMLVWEAQSGSTGVVQVLHRFFYESFIILETAAHFTDWSVILYSRDVRKIGPIEARSRFNLLTGVPIVDKDIQENLLRSYKEKKKNLIEQLNKADSKIQTLKQALEREKQHEKLQKKRSLP